MYVSICIYVFLFVLRLEESLPAQLVFAPEVDEEILQRL